MGTGCDEDLLGNHDVCANSHLVLVMYPHTLTYPGSIPYPKLPWELYPGTWSKYDAVSDDGAERTERCNPQPRTGLPSISQNEELDGAPKIDRSLGPVPDTPVTGSPR